MTPKRDVQSEAQVKRAVQDLLKARGIMCFRMNAGDRFGTYKGRTWKIAGHPSGTADILCFLLTHWNAGTAIIDIPIPVWVETKSQTGKQSREQKQFQKMVEGAGHEYLLVRSASELNDWLDGNS